jgi:hypothetical protein
MACAVYSAKGRIVNNMLRTLDERPSIFTRDNPILSPERILRMDYDRKGLVENALVVSLKGLGAKTN